MSKTYWDYIPPKDSELVPWGSNFNSKVSVNASRWGIPLEEVTEVQTAYDVFVPLHKKADSPDSTTVIVAEKNVARKNYVTLVRAMVGFRLKNPIITDAERLDMGLHVHDTTPTTIDVPTTHPVLLIEILDFRRLKVSFKDQNTTSKAKPYGVVGAVFKSIVLDAPATDYSVLTNSIMVTRTPKIFEFTEDERTKVFSIAACWQNEKGQTGPWCEIVSVIIP
ncbi:MAG: hypothetical protein LBK96_01690 [Prevotellaceae bacterium]|jgi:hypothetical protein|nr:hypothetical protein [Prevotellaceae bacterium]